MRAFPLDGEVIPPCRDQRSPRSVENSGEQIGLTKGIRGALISAALTETHNVTSCAGWSRQPQPEILVGIERLDARDTKRLADVGDLDPLARVGGSGLPRHDGVPLGVRDGDES